MAACVRWISWRLPAKEFIPRGFDSRRRFCWFVRYLTRRTSQHPASVTQWIEYPVSTRLVGGSNPSWGTHRNDERTTMERQLVTREQITDIQPIEGADAIEVASVRGWKVVVRKGEFTVGDEVVYFEIDSALPLA